MAFDGQSVVGQGGRANGGGMSAMGTNKPDPMVQPALANAMRPGLSLARMAPPGTRAGAGRGGAGPGAGVAPGVQAPGTKMNSTQRIRQQQAERKLAGSRPGLMQGTMGGRTLGY